MVNEPQRRGATENPVYHDKELTEKIIGCAMEVHRHLGPGLLESAYEECLCHELSAQGMPFERQKPPPKDLFCNSVPLGLWASVVKFIHRKEGTAIIKNHNRG